jgi:glycosyltransferase involved in cell wall biosynthesis
LREYPEVGKSGINPLLHYLRIGVPDRAMPHQLFDTWFYLKQLPSDPALIENPLLQFLEDWSSNLANPHPLFDVSFYQRLYPDVVSSKKNPLLHYIMVGATGGCDPHPLFDTSFYLDQLPEAPRNGVNPLVHFLEQSGANATDPHPLFDISFYLQMYPDVKKERANALVHFVRYGAAEKKDPSPFFDTAYYLANYLFADDTGLNPLVHFLTDGVNRGYNPSPLFDTSYYSRAHLSQVLVNDFLKPIDPVRVNPLIHYAMRGRFENLITRKVESNWTQLDRSAPQLVCMSDGKPDANQLKFLDEVKRSCKHLFLMGCLMRGGAERSACHCIQFAAESAGSVEDILVIVTDVANLTCLDWLPENIRIINLAELFPKLAQHDRGALILRLIADTRAETVHLFNSPRAHAALGYYLDSYQKPSAKLLSYLCGFELYTDHNFAGFHEGALYYAAHHLDLMITDNDRLCKTIVESYKHIAAIESKVVTCYQPLMTSLCEELSINPTLERNFRRKVLWASRIDATKRPDVLARIAQALPDVQFDVFGYSSGGYDYSYLHRLKNIELMGEYSDFGQIPKDDKAVFLYTSDADGMPNVLLEAIAAGLPIIAPHVGGIGELITNETGWLVERFDDVEHYVRLLKYVLSHNAEAERRANNGLKLLSERHSWTSFSKRLTALGVI